MKLHKLIKQKLSNASEDTLLKNMGYQSLKIGKRTLEYFLNQKDIFEWLKNGHYDLKYSSESFVIALSKALSIPAEEYLPKIQKAREKIEMLSKMREPVIFINSSEPPPFFLTQDYLITTDARSWIPYWRWRD